MTHTPGPFRRNIILRYPARLLPTDLAQGFSAEVLVTVTIETFEEISAGSTVLEATYQYQNGQITKLAERTFVFQ